MMIAVWIGVHYTLVIVCDENTDNFRVFFKEICTDERCVGKIVFNLVNYLIH